MSLGKKIKFYRNKMNLSQEKFAKKCNLSRNAIYNYENSKRTPTTSVLITIAEQLNVSVNDLMSDTKNLTQIIVDFLDSNVFKDIDSTNTIELISETIDIDFDIIIDAINNEEDISESYLSTMLTYIYADNKKNFINLLKENEKLIWTEYPICKETCLDLIQKYLDSKISFNDIVALEDNFSNNIEILSLIYKKTKVKQNIINNLKIDLKKFEKYQNNLNQIVLDFLNNPNIKNAINIDFDYNTLTNKEMSKINRSIFNAIQQRIDEIIDDREENNHKKDS